MTTITAPDGKVYQVEICERCGCKVLPGDYEMHVDLHEIRQKFFEHERDELKTKFERMRG